MFPSRIFHNFSCPRAKISNLRLVVLRFVTLLTFYTSDFLTTISQQKFYNVNFTKLCCQKVLYVSPIFWAPKSET